MDRIVTFGEIMLRLKSPEHERFFQSPVLEATFGGGEANVAVSLSILGKQSAFVTALPENPIADGAIQSLQKYGVDVSGIKRMPGRVGIYYLESGANQRPSADATPADIPSLPGVCARVPARRDLQSERARAAHGLYSWLCADRRAMR